MKQPNEDQPGKNASDSAARPPLTRREMLVTIGGAAILYGLPEVAQGALPRGQSSSAPFPPGLYKPSLDHLTHALSAETRFPPIPAGTQTEYVRPLSEPFTPQAFTSSEFAVVRRLVEIILGDDLRASDPLSETHAEVAEWIDLVVARAPQVRSAALNLTAEHRALAVAYFGSEAPVKQMESFAPEQICRDGLAWFAEESLRRFGKPFLDADHDAQLDLVHEISDSRSDPSIENAGTRFFAFLKEHCIRGFFTSQKGLEELDFKGNHFYAHSPGCSLSPKS